MNGASVTDLQDGDVVDLTDAHGTVIRGTLRAFGTTGGRPGLTLGGEKSAGLVIRRVDGCLAGSWEGWTLTVIKRAPRLYVNHDRTEPVAGDVVRDAEDPWNTDTWVCADRGDTVWPWLRAKDAEWCGREELPERLRLIVDGSTGEIAR